MRTFLMSSGLAALAFVPAATAQARPIPQVQQFVQEQITALAKVQQPQIVTDDHFGGGDGGDFALSLFRLRIQAEAGFDIGLARVTVVPVAEFFWE